MERLRDHILKEQDGLFPASLSILDADAWASVETARVVVGSALEPEPHSPGHPHDHAHHHPHDEDQHDQHATAHQHA